MVKKIKFFDSIIFSGDVEFLKFRLTELDPYVDYFIIADFNHVDSDLSFTKNKHLFEIWNDKIFHLSVTDTTFLNDINKQFISLKPNFEDVLMISQVNELPDFNDVNEFLNKLKFDSLILEHTNFIWSKDYIDNDLHRGTLMFSFSLILRQNNIIKTIFDRRFSPTIHKDTIFKNGWRFSNFGYDENYKYQINELLPPTEINPISTYKLIKHNNNIPLPKNLHLLPYFKIGRDLVKKHLFLVESDLEFVNQDYYDTITIINFNSNLQEILCEKLSDKITKSILYLPTVVLYGEPETFQDEYMMNETKRMFSVVFPQEQDIIEVIFKNEKPLVLGGVSN